MIETTHCKLSIFLTWKQFKTKSIAKDSKQKEFLFFSFFFSISIISTKDLFNSKKFELLVSQKSETLLSVTVLIFKNFFSSFWMISYFFEFRKAKNDHTKKIKKFNSKIEKIRTNKFSIDELTEEQTNEHEVKTIFSSISNFFSFIEENDINDDWFFFAELFEIEKTANDATEQNAKNRKKIKVESQNSQSEWTFSSTINSAKKQTTHTNFFFKSFSKSNFEISFQSFSSKNETDAKNSTKQINKYQNLHNNQRFLRWW
jgi:hypothetical protein